MMTDVMLQEWMKIAAWIAAGGFAAAAWRTLGRLDARFTSLARGISKLELDQRRHSEEIRDTVSSLARLEANVEALRDESRTAHAVQKEAITALRDDVDTLKDARFSR